MSFKWAKIYFSILPIILILLSGCQNGSNNINAIKNNSNFYNKSLPNKFQSAAAAPSIVNSDEVVIEMRGNIGKITINGKVYYFIVPKALISDGVKFNGVAYLNKVGSKIYLILVSNSSKSVYRISLDLALPKIRDQDYYQAVLEQTTEFPDYSINTIYDKLLSINNQVFVVMSSGKDTSLVIQFNANGTNGTVFETQPETSVCGVEYDKDKKKLKLSISHWNERYIDNIFLNLANPGDSEEYEDDLPEGMAAGWNTPLASRGINNHGSSVFEMVYIPPAASDVQQTVAICTADESGPCTATYIDNQNPIATAASNVISNSQLYSLQNNPIDLAFTSNGDVYQLNNNIWSYRSSLNMSLGPLAAAFIDNTGMFNVIGISNSSGQVNSYASEDGSFWEDTNIREFREITATNNSFCAIEDDSSDPDGSGKISCWGSNEHNKLGLNPNQVTNPPPTRALIPAPIGIPSGETGKISYSSLSAGDSSICALRSSSNNKIDCWGSDGLGELGDGITHDPSFSTPIPTSVNMSGISSSVKKLVSGGSHSCILTEDNQVSCWGSNQDHEVDGVSTQTIFTSPHLASYNLPFNYTDIASGANFTCAMNSILINCWGNGYSLPYQKVAAAEDGFGNFIDISASGGTACVITDKINNNSHTNLLCWGDNTYGQVGNNSNASFIPTPQPVYSKTPLQFVSIRQSGTNTCAITNSTPTLGSNAYCWGDNTYQQTGISNTTTKVLYPQQAIYLGDSPGVFASVNPGQGSTCLVSNEMTATSGVMHNTYCLGDNSTGQLGIGSTIPYATEPQLVTNPNMFLNQKQ